MIGIFIGYFIGKLFGVAYGLRLYYEVRKEMLSR